MTVAENEAGLVERSKRGDRAAFGQLVACYDRKLLRYLWRLVGDEDVALDLTQDTFLRAYRSMAATTEDLALGPWLKRIATNLAFDYLRRRRRLVWLPLSVVDHFIHVDDCTPTPIVECDLVQHALSQLTPEERAVLLLCGLDDMALVDAGRVLGLSTDAVRKRFSRAKARFRAIYTRLSPEAGCE